MDNNIKEDLIEEVAGRIHLFHAAKLIETFRRGSEDERDVRNRAERERHESREEAKKIIRLVEGVIEATSFTKRAAPKTPDIIPMPDQSKKESEDGEE